MGQVIQSSLVSESVSLYKDVRVINSKLSNKVIVGDFSRVYNSELADFVRIDRSCFIYHSHINQYSYTGSSTTIMHSVIGRFCSISWGVTVGPGAHDYNRPTSHDFLYNPQYGFIEDSESAVYDRFGLKTEIGNDVWIGTNATILQGVKIGDGAVVGANSLVSKDVPPYAIVGGCPAKVIKYRFNSDIIKELLELKWWNLSPSFIKENFDLFKIENIEEFIKKIKQIL